MKKLSDKSRKLLRAFYMLIGAGAVSFVFQACYGVPHDPVIIDGKVVSKSTNEPVPGIKVSIENDYYKDYYKLSNSKGEFMFTDYSELYEYIFNFEDLEGNYKKHQETVKSDENKISLTVYLEKNDE